MSFIVVICVHLSMLLPIYGEGAFDFLMWKAGKDDKPVSTWVARPVFFAVGTFLAWIIGDKELWRIGIVMITAFLAFFNPQMGLILKKGICHLGKGWWDTLIGKIPGCAPRLWLFFWLYILSLCIYYYYELYNLFY